MSNFDSIIKKIAVEQGLNPIVIKAICMKESSLDTFKIRYEPQWSYRYKAVFYAKKHNISLSTEICSQQISWGLMQVMGTVAREHDFEENLCKLLIPEHGILIGCRVFRKLLDKHKDLRTSLIAYNAGSGALESIAGNTYADAVLDLISELQRKKDAICN